MSDKYLGMGVMINQLFGADRGKALRESLGKTIAGLTLADESLRFEFTDGSKMRLLDDGQSCCESRYMRTDDKLEEYIGAKLLGAEVKEAPEMPDEYGNHEVEFLEVKTDRGVLTMASHNEHNGYYGGFYIRSYGE